MKNKLIPLFDEILLRKRSVTETVNEQLKSIAQIEHTRYRSPVNFLVKLGRGAHQLYAAIEETPE